MRARRRSTRSSPPVDFWAEVDRRIKLAAKKARAHAREVADEISLHERVTAPAGKSGQSAKPHKVTPEADVGRLGERLDRIDADKLQVAVLESSRHRFGHHALPLPNTDGSMGTTQFQGLYNRARWKKMSQQQRMRAPLCEMCRARGIIVVAEVVDHIRPHHGDESLFYDPQNLQSLCKKCHDTHKARAERSGETWSRAVGPDGDEEDDQAGFLSSAMRDGRTRHMGGRRVVECAMGQDTSGEAPSPAMVANLSPEQSEELTIYPPRSLGEAFRAIGARKNGRARRRAPGRLVALLEAHRAGVRRLRSAYRHAGDHQRVAQGDRGDRLAARGSSLPEDLANTVEGVGRARLLRSRCRSGARRAQQCRKGPVRWRMGYYCLAAVIAVSWDTQLAPGKVRALRASQLGAESPERRFSQSAEDGRPDWRRAQRPLWPCWPPTSKSSASRGAVLRSAEPAKLPQAVRRALLVRHAGRRLSRSSRRRVRPGRARTIGQDFRPSGAVEAIVGGAKSEHLAHAMDNSRKVGWPATGAGKEVKA